MKLAKFLVFKPGLVIGEFVCDRIDKYPYNKEFGYEISEESFNKTMLTADEFCNYGKGKPLYGWHISALKIYDKPKELSEFSLLCKRRSGAYSCDYCKYLTAASWDGLVLGCDRRLRRPPQAWCYVEQAYGDEGGHTDDKRRR